MTKLPQIKPQKLIKALKRMGFEVKRKSGSHFRLVHPDGRNFGKSLVAISGLVVVEFASA